MNKNQTKKYPYDVENYNMDINHYGLTFACPCFNKI